MTRPQLSSRLPKFDSLTTCPQWLAFCSCGTISQAGCFIPLFDKITLICIQIGIKLSRVLFPEGDKAKRHPSMLQRYISAMGTVCQYIDSCA
jgi:hypothetical protein